MPKSSPSTENAAFAGRWVALLLFASGAVALVYEVVWQRQFALVLGSAASATAAVLAAYFAGLGLGSLIVGRWAKRIARPLRAYAGIEALVGAGALLVTPLLAQIERGYAGGFQMLAPHPALLVAAKVSVVFVALLLPTFCMGGTLPLLGQLVDRGRRRLGLTAGWLYVANTVGAGVGALLVPFWLLPSFGLRETVWLCAAVNGGLAAVAWWLDRAEERSLLAGDERRGQVPIACQQAPTPEAARGREAPSSGLWLALGSGGATFALQVLWNRAFAQIHENSMYSFAVIVAVVIFALAIGAQLARVGLRRGIAPRRLIGGAWLLAGVAVVLGPVLFLRWTDGMSYLSAEGGWLGEAVTLAGLAGGLVLPAMALLGVGLPAIMEQAGASGGEEGAGRVLGRLLGVNIAGSVVGALVAGFVVPQWPGLWGGMMGLGVVLIVVGVVQLLRPGRAWRWGVAAGAVVGALLVARLDLPRVRLAKGETLLGLREGTHGIAAVVERPGSRRLKLNNHYGLGGTASTGDERMQAHVPLLLHPAPRSVAFLGLGTGISAGGALFHPVEKVTVVELVPEVIAASREFFGAENAQVLDDPRTRVVADDARHFLRGTRERFDVIVGDLVVPWRAGEGSLFTAEQFELARHALAPGGIFCQWLPLFQLSETETMILVRTFLTVFPQAQIWRGDFSPTEPAIALVGSAGRFQPDAETVRRRLGEMRADAANPQLAVTGIFWMQRVGAIEAADLPATEQRINREERPWIELLGPMLHGGGRRKEAAGAGGANALFIGRRLQAWLDEVAGRSSGRVALLPEPEATAAAAGRTVVELILRMAEEDRAGAAAEEERLRRALPAETFQALFR